MTNSNYNNLRVENVETLPLKNNNKEKVEFIVNDFKHLNDSDIIFDVKDGNQKLRKNREFSKRLFHNLRIDNIYYTKTQKWMGHITEINENGFNAILKDLTNGGTDEYGEFLNDEITKDDLNLVTKGATFYMSLGFISINGARKRESEIRFQRLADFNQEDVVNSGLDLTSKFINYFK